MFLQLKFNNLNNKFNNTIILNIDHPLLVLMTMIVSHRLHLSCISMRQKMNTWMSLPLGSACKLRKTCMMNRDTGCQSQRIKTMIRSSSRPITTLLSRKYTLRIVASILSKRLKERKKRRLLVIMLKLLSLRLKLRNSRLQKKRNLSRKAATMKQ